MIARAILKTVSYVIVLASLTVSAHAQAVDDGVMLPRGNLVVGDIYLHERWDEYWEGTRKRDNGNIGTLTTQANILFAGYGVTGRLNVFAAVPYVWTRASQGVLHGMQGFQDITLAAKYTLFERPTTRLGSLRAFAVASGGTPLTDYTPDFQPLSIGMGSRRLSGRLTLSVQPASGWFASGSAAYTWRGKVTLDRPYYYTDGQLFFSDQVEMPNVFDYTAVAGFARRRVMAAFGFSQQHTLGGGDIRRQDMPFVSNRMNFSRVAGMVIAPIPKLENLAGQFSYTYTVAGRNVGQATTMSTGLVYRVPFLGRTTP